MTAASRVTSQNQTSVPAAVRKRFRIHPGTVLEWHEVRGELVVRPRRVSLADLRAEVRRMVGPRRATLAELERGKLKAVAERFARGRG